MIPMPLDSYTKERQLLWYSVLLQVVQDANRLLVDPEYGQQRDMFDKEPPNGNPTRWDCLRAINWIVGQSPARKSDRDMVCEFLGRDGDKFRSACIENFRQNSNLNEVITNIKTYLEANREYSGSMVER